jgi:URI fold toxin 2
MPHNNSNQNMKPHHLYEIIDKEGEDVFKYGISHVVDAHVRHNQIKK